MQEAKRRRDDNPKEEGKSSERDLAAGRQRELLKEAAAG